MGEIAVYSDLKRPRGEVWALQVVTSQQWDTTSGAPPGIGASCSKTRHGFLSQFWLEVDEIKE
jgi:hypothetical protein